jgi:hypothetical protein
MELWVGCIAGALRDSDYILKLSAAGFTDIGVDPWRVYRIEDARTFLAEAGLDADRIAKEIDGQVASAFIRVKAAEIDMLRP